MKKINSKARKRKVKAWGRFSLQMVFFIFAPSLYSSAFAGLKSSVENIGRGQALEFSSFVIQLAILCGVTVLTGRFFCGWACAFGTLNDVVYTFFSWLEKKAKWRLPGIHPKIMVFLRFAKYGILLAILWLCFTQHSQTITANSPWTAFSLVRSWQLNALKNAKAGFIILLLLLPGMALQERFFCQCFCPMGAVFSLLPVNPLLQLKRNKENCPAKCGACKKICPVNLMLDPDNPLQGECIRCGKCLDICPRSNIRIFKRT